jgi:hypothetical protein
VLECKTHNRKSFDDLEKNGIEKSKPVHFAQCQVGMGMSGIQRAAYIAQCKDDDRLYLERIHFDEKVFKALRLKAERIINEETAPDRISDKVDFFRCRYLCPFSKICHEDGRPEIHCRTCIHSSPVDDGKWACAKNCAMEPDCFEHVLIPSLLSWAEPIDGEPEWIKYRIKKNGREFLNVAGTGFPAMELPHYSSKELSVVPIDAIGDEKVELAREILGGETI